MDFLVQEIIKSFDEFFQKGKTRNNHRYLSWEHCYKQFYYARNEQKTDELVDKLSLHLAFYLASWGMYRGSSFLLQCDYQVHIPIVKKILEPKYDCLLGLDCRTLLNNFTVKNNLVDLSYHLNILYSDIRESVYQEKNEILKRKEVSIVLITKVLLGTLGCIPAYDRFFVNGIQKTDIAKNIYQLTSIEKSIYQLAEFYEKNRANFEEVRSSYNIDGKLPYPQMKLLDLGLWIIGSKNEK